VYSFGAGHNEGRADMRNLLGGKGANLAEMASIGLPVPPGFTITTEVCTHYYAHGKQYPATLVADVKAALARIEEAVGLKFGDPSRPLLVSVRSGARVSMPGMMDTVLNLGLNDTTVEGLAAASGDARFAWDSYRRFIQMFGSVVLDVDHHRFEEIIEEVKLARGRLARGGAWLHGHGRRGHRRALPAGPRGPAVARHRRRVRLLDECPRQHL
jgi:pyruvate,orthophosphate dikinase